MYDGWRSKHDVDLEWVNKTNDFMEATFGDAPAYVQLKCPCARCDNRRAANKEKMGLHLFNNGWTQNYHVWTYHGEVQRVREEVVRQRLEACDDDAGVADWLDDVQQAQFAQSRNREEMEEDARNFYEMLDAAGQPLHEHTDVCRLDAVGRLLGLKAELKISRDGFDKMLKLVGSLLPKPHRLPLNMHESKNLLKALKMPYEQIHACPKGCVLFRNEHADLKYCPKCKSSRYQEVPSADGEKEQLPYANKILRYLPFLPRLQRLYMTEEFAKQMT